MCRRQRWYLQPDSTTQSAFSFNAAIFDAIGSPSLSGLASGGGVNTSAGTGATYDLMPVELTPLCSPGTVLTEFSD